MPDNETDLLLARLAVRELIDNWILWRDSQQWDRVATLWHEGGVMATTWGGTQTPAEFAASATKGFADGDRMLHANGGTSVDINGDRAIAQTKLRIMQRAEVEGVLCDVTCIGRDYDLCERRDGRWRFVYRQPIYERDSIVPVDPNDRVELDPALLAALPDGYARLGYLQHRLGYEIVPTMPVLEGEAVEGLVAAGEAWLAGGEFSLAEIGVADADPIAPATASTVSPTAWEPYGDPGDPVGEAHFVRRGVTAQAPEVGIWRVDPADIPDELPEVLEHAETFHVLSGSGELDVEGQGTIALEPGVVVSIAQGASVVWRFATPFSKLFILS